MCGDVRHVVSTFTVWHVFEQLSLYRLYLILRTHALKWVGEKLHPTLEIDRFTIEFAGLEYAIWDLPFGMARVVMANLNFCKVVCQSVVSAVCTCVPCTQYRPIYICGLDPRGQTTRKEMQRRSSCCHGFWRKNDTQRITAIQDTDTPLDWIVRWCKMSFSFRSISGQPSNWYQPISACQRCGLCLEPNATSSVFVQFHNCWSTKKKRTRL